MPISLTQPPAGSTGWGAAINTNFQTIEDAFNGDTSIGPLLGAASFGRLRIEGTNGYCLFGPANYTSTWFDSDRSIYDFNVKVMTNYGYSSYLGFLYLKTSNTTRVTGDNVTGYIGIGTSSPNSLLHINGPLGTTTSTKTANYSITVSDNVIFADATSGAITLTLPAASSTTIGRLYTVFKVDSSANSVTIAATGSDTVNGTSSTTTQWKRIKIYGYSATAWVTVAT